jgi:hypothetical protein
MIDEAQVTSLHEAAMGYAQEAMHAPGRDEVRRLYGLAFASERQAAELLQGEWKEEPTRSILYRSAATLARDCEEFKEAERLIAAGLSGFPPADVAGELRDLWELVRFDMRLAAENVVLEREDFQLTVSGDGIAPGVAGEAFIVRYRVAQRLFVRIAEMILAGGAHLRERFRDSLRFFIAAVEPGSFVMTVRVGQEKQPSLLPELNQTGRIIDELIEVTQLFQDGTDADIARRLPDEEYRRDLRQLFDQFGPDGKDVSLVGLASTRDGEVRKATITRRRSIPFPELLAAETERREKLNRTVFRGKLLYANEMTKKPKIIIQDESGERFPLFVGESMDEIVRPLWGKMVFARGEWRGKRPSAPSLVEIYEDR